MDKKIQKILEGKIHESTDRINEIVSLSNAIGLRKNKGFEHGIIIGRLYNSFYYQSRRILKRNPTEQEFFEFIQLLKDHYDEFRELSAKFN